ncbi:MAG TPA: serine hydrolase [Pyrinomonadaceae bacterium]|nr:serine hydrolase [Pyrinomonadaceae bacterium]
MKTSIRRASLLLAVCLLVSASARAQTDAEGRELASRLDKRLTELAARKRFSGAALVAREGRVILSQGYGMANYELDVPNTPQTKFRLGSLTKQFTAAAVLLLQERGKLSVQDSVCKHVEGCPAAWQSVTVHHLLTHTSGIPSFTSFPEYRQTSRLPTTIPDIIKRFRDRPLEFAPGERFNYSNSGYVLLGHLVEKISGKSYEEFLRENFFVPAGMTRTGYDRNEEVLPGRASGYVLRDGRLYNADFIDMSIPHGAGALYSTVEDLYLWDQSLYGGKLLSAKSLEAMTTPFRVGYAYGVGVRPHWGSRSVAHGGGIEGFNTYLVRWDEPRTTVVVLSNIENVNTASVATALAREALSDKIAVPATVRVEPAVLKTYEGRYEADQATRPGLFLDVTAEGDKLFVKYPSQDRHLLAPVAAAEFLDFDDPNEARFVFGKDAGGGATLTASGFGPEPLVMRRITLPPPSLRGNTTFRLKGHTDASLVALAGTFNEWNQSRTLCGREGDGWVCRLDLPPGKHLYKFVVDGEWMPDPANPARERDPQGNVNSVLMKQ